MLRFCLIALFFSISVAANANKPCKNKPASQLYDKLEKKLVDAQEVAEANVKAIKSNLESVKVAKRTKDISSSVTYTLAAVGGAAAIMATGFAALSAGAASLVLRFGSTASKVEQGMMAVGKVPGNILYPMGIGTVVGGGRLVPVFNQQGEKFDVNSLSYDYESSTETIFNPYYQPFTNARINFQKLQKEMASRKGAETFFNLNGNRELKRRRLNAIDSFFGLQITILEIETIKKSLAYLSENCNSETILLDINIEGEIRKITKAYRDLENLDLEDEFEKNPKVLAPARPASR